ncbi:UNVERIFIED_ORG: hypothetical protein QOE_3960 [Clostridioides difficile F501]
MIPFMHPGNSPSLPSSSRTRFAHAENVAIIHRATGDRRSHERRAEHARPPPTARADTRIRPK